MTRSINCSFSSAYYEHRAPNSSSIEATTESGTFVASLDGFNFTNANFEVVPTRIAQIQDFSY